jgi:hypothetical protein
VDDQHAVFARFLEHVMHARSHLTFTGHGIFAVMEIPPVTNDNRRASWLPWLFDESRLGRWRARWQREVGGMSSQRESKEKC